MQMPFAMRRAFLLAPRSIQIIEAFRLPDEEPRVRARTPPRQPVSHPTNEEPSRGAPAGEQRYTKQDTGGTKVQEAGATQCTSQVGTGLCERRLWRFQPDDFNFEAAEVGVVVFADAVGDVDE